MILDIPWFTDYFSVLFSLDESKYMVDVIPGKILHDTNSSALAKVIKSFRLIRLIRIIKLYNYAVKSNAAVEEAKLREQQKLSTTAQ